MGKWDSQKKKMKKNPTLWQKFQRQRRADKAQAYINSGKIPVSSQKKEIQEDTERVLH